MTCTIELNKFDNSNNIGFPYHSFNTRSQALRSSYVVLNANLTLKHPAYQTSQVSVTLEYIIQYQRNASSECLLSVLSKTFQFLKIDGDFRAQTLGALSGKAFTADIERGLPLVTNKLNKADNILMMNTNP